MGEHDLEQPPGPDLSPAQVRKLRQQNIADSKDRGLDVSLEAIATEIETRAKDGRLAEDLKGMKTGALLGNLTRIAAAIKQSAVVVVPGGLPTHDPTALRAQSAVHLSEHERNERRRAALADVQEADVIPPEAS